MSEKATKESVLDFCRQNPRSLQELVEEFDDPKSPIQELLYNGKLDTTPSWEFYTND